MNYDELIAQWIALRLAAVHQPWHQTSIDWITEKERDGDDAAPDILALEVLLRLRESGSSF
jgi:hypothetical protein